MAELSNRQVYVVDGRPHRLCDCKPREGACPRGVERSLHTAELSRCFVPAEGVILGDGIALTLQSTPLGYVLVELAKINNLTERIKALADANSADAKSLAADAALLLEARRG